MVNFQETVMLSKAEETILRRAEATTPMLISVMQLPQPEPSYAIRKSKVPASSRTRRKRVSILISIPTTTIAKTAITAETRTSVAADVETREETKEEAGENNMK